MYADGGVHCSAHTYYVQYNIIYILLYIVPYSLRKFLGGDGPRLLQRTNELYANTRLRRRDSRCVYTYIECGLPVQLARAQARRRCRRNNLSKYIGYTHYCSSVGARGLCRAKRNVPLPSPPPRSVAYTLLVYYNNIPIHNTFLHTGTYIFQVGT